MTVKDEANVSLALLVRRIRNSLVFADFRCIQQVQHRVRKPSPPRKYFVDGLLVLTLPFFPSCPNRLVYLSCAKNAIFSPLLPADKSPRSRIWGAILEGAVSLARPTLVLVYFLPFVLGLRSGQSLAAEMAGRALGGFSDLLPDARLCSESEAFFGLCGWGPVSFVRLQPFRFDALQR